MSDYDSEDFYDSEDSDYEYDSDASDDDSDGSEATYTSLEAALAEMTERLHTIDAGLESMTGATQSLEQPMTAVAIQSFVNPRVLETAPFRQTRFRLRRDAKEFLGMPHHTVTFAELCAAIRLALKTKPKEELESMWGTVDFLGVLQRMQDIVE